jgi:raffinose/stachyose/melibiose transport system substrate-binding protein
MTPGFMQLKREDATFYFLQQRSIFIATGSWDIKSLSGQANFPIGVFNVPMPDKQDPEYGRYILGAVSENANAGTPFAITQNSEHPEIALDFLKFLSSYKANGTFSEISLWYPSVVGVEPPEEVKPFTPITEGYPVAYSLLALSADTKRLTDNNLYLLFGKEKDAVTRFIDAIRPSFRQSILSDLARSNKTRLRNVGRFNCVAETLAWNLEKKGLPAAARDRKLDELLLNQAMMEVAYYKTQKSLSAPPPQP